MAPRSSTSSRSPHSPKPSHVHHSPPLPPPHNTSPSQLRSELSSRGVARENHATKPAPERAATIARRSSAECRAEEEEFGTPASLPKRETHRAAVAGMPMPPIHVFPPPPLRRDSAGSASPLPPSVLRAIAASSDPTLSSINFSNRPLHHSSLVQLSKALETNTTVTTLNLANCSLDDASCPPLAEVLSRNSTLSALHLDSNSIGVEGTASLSAALITNSSLKTLTLNSNPLGDRGLIYLAKACAHNVALTTLETEACQISQTGRAKALQDALRKRRIDGNFESLLERLSDDDHRVTGVDLSGRPLGDEGILRLSDALADNTHVRQLWLRDCGVADPGAGALASCLEQNMSIVDLFLGGNEIGDAGLKSLCEALGGSNDTLVSLEMDDNRVTEVGVGDFVRALEKNASVLLATFENNDCGNDCLERLDGVLDERRKGLNLVSFVVDPEEEEGEEEEERSGVVNMSVCSSYMPSTYRRAGFRSVASTKYSRSIRNSGSSVSIGSHIFSIYNKSASKQRSSFSKPAPQQVSASAGAVHHSPPPPPPMVHHSPSRLSPHPEALAGSSEHLSGSDRVSGSDRTGKKSSRTEKTPASAATAPSVLPTRALSSDPSVLPARTAQPIRTPGNAANSAHHDPTPSRNAPPPPQHVPLQPRAPMAQPQNHALLKRVSSESSSRRSRQSSRTQDPPASPAQNRTVMHATRPQQQPVLERVDSYTHSRDNVKVGSVRGNSQQQQQVAQYVPVMTPVVEASVETSVGTEPSINEKSHSKTAEHYDKTMKELCRRVEMMRLSNYFTALHYRCRHFWLWFAPISSCIFLAGILSLASAVDVAGLAPLVLSLCTAFFSLVAFVLNFLQTRFGWSSLAQSHRTASLELAQVGFQLEKLKQYEGGQLSSRSVSSRARASAVRDVYRIDVYLSAMEKCTPAIPMPIEHAFNLLVSRMKAFCNKYPNAIKVRLQEYDEECFDPDDPVPLEMQLDAFDLLCQEIRGYAGFPMFLPNPQKMVNRTVNQFFAKQAPPPRRERRRSSSSSESRGSKRASLSESRGQRRGSYDSRTDSRRDSYDSRTETDVYTQESQSLVI